MTLCLLFLLVCYPFLCLIVVMTLFLLFLLVCYPLLCLIVVMTLFLLVLLVCYPFLCLIVVRFVKCKGVRPCVYRVFYRRHKESQAYTLTNKSLFSSLVCSARP